MNILIFLKSLNLVDDPSKVELVVTIPKKLFASSLKVFSSFEVISLALKTMEPTPPKSISVKT